MRSTKAVVLRIEADIRTSLSGHPLRETRPMVALIHSPMAVAIAAAHRIEPSFLGLGKFA
jgi:hypothetical protein